MLLLAYYTVTVPGQQPQTRLTGRMRRPAGGGGAASAWDGICLSFAAVIAVLLLMGQVIRIALTQDGSALAEALAGIGKAAAAFALTFVVASSAVTAAGSLTSYIVRASFGR